MSGALRRFALAAWLVLSCAGGGLAQTPFEAARAGDAEAIAAYEQRFQEATTEEEKKKVAMTLAAAGGAGEEHIQFLEDHGLAAAQSSRPYPFAFAADGSRIQPPTYSVEFVAWVEARAEDLEEQMAVAMVVQPSDILRLAVAEEPRFDAVLTTALESPNYAVQLAAVKALVSHGHLEAVPDVELAVAGTPAEIRAAAGMSLLLLEDDAADEVARSLIGDESLYQGFRDAARTGASNRRAEYAEYLANGPAPGGPRLSAHPGSAMVRGGDEVALSCGVEEVEAATFSWQRDGVLVVDGPRVSGAETATLTLYQVNPADGGAYRCLVETADGETISGPGQLVVLVAPAITGHPVAQTATVNSTASLTCSATGSEPLEYRWLRANAELVDGPRISGAATPVLTLSMLTEADAGSYRCRVRNDLGEALSSTASLAVGQPPTITASPQDATASRGATISLSCAASGTPTLLYRWRKDGAYLASSATLAGVWTPTLTIQNAQPADSGAYSCRVRNGYGQSFSAAATVTIGDPPAITAHPAALTRAVGSSASFSCSSSGSAPLAYRWQKNGINLANGGRISGVTSATLSLINLQSSDAGNYRCVASNAFGQAISAAAGLTLGTAPAITTQPVNRTAWAGSSTSFSCLSSGSGPLQYSWKKGATVVTDGGGITGSASRILRLDRITAGRAGQYRCVASSPYGTATSNAATLNFQDWRAYPWATTQREGFSPDPMHEQLNDGVNVVTSTMSHGTLDSFTVRMAAIPDPQTDSGHNVYIWGRALDNAPATIRVQVLQGTNLLQWSDHQLGAEVAWIRVPVNAQAAANITNYADVRIRVLKWHQAWNTSDRRVEIQRIELRVPDTPPPVQIALPVATTARNSFAPTPIHTRLDDDVNVVTSTYNNGTVDGFTVRMAPVSDPGVHSGHVVRVTGRALDLAPGTVRIYLQQGTNTLYWANHEFGLATSVFRLALPASVAAQITNYSDLRVAVTKWHFIFGANGDRRMEIRKIELEVPD